MKQWIWPFKKFPSSNQASTFKTRAAVAGILGGIVILGCQNLMRPTPSGSAPAMAMEDKSHIVASIKVYIQDANQKEAYVGEFDRTTCVDGLPTLWVTSFNSLFGQHHFDFDFTAIADHKSNSVNIKAGQEHFQVLADAYPKAIAGQGLCDLPFRTDSTHLPANSEAGKELMSLLAAVAPDCLFQTDKDGKLECAIGHANEQSIRSRLDQLTKNMSTKWNHQPYLLIRRLTLTKQLLEASVQNDDLKSVHKFCRILEFSLPNELPLSFRSKTWQTKVCHDKKMDNDLVLVGLDHAVREIESLANRIEDTSLIGTFTLAVPRDKSPVKEYWITLQPLDLPILVKSENPILNACVWHPLFADQVDKALIAMDLGQILSTSNKSFCTPIPDLTKAKKDSDNYIRTSIASEMEFPIVNGQSKQLRLPTGDYKFSITQLNGPFSEEMFTTEEIIPISIGQVSWKTNRPHLIIKNW